MSNPITSLSIAARMTLNMHSLNNEGGEGNQIQTRMIDILGADKQLHSVNAISGDMLKHVLMEHLFRRAREEKLSLCSSCQQFNVNRVSADEPFLRETESKKYAEFIDQLLPYCVMDDIGGVMITAKQRSVSRKSVCEFGWVAAIPELSRTESYFHAKYVPERNSEQRQQDANDQESGSNQGQNIFHRPASSGAYALVCHLELWRIGYNDITQSYVLTLKERQQRAALLLECVMYTFLELNGAMRSIQLPHLTALEGFISTSNSAVPAPILSPLMGNHNHPFTYREQAHTIAVAFNALKKSQPIAIQDFDTLADFAQQMSKLIHSITPEPQPTN